ncbi:NAD-dependent protein deacetylase sirtuin-7 [Dermacentor albipictus]|uniref:NAD-dependent protein deacetylase sirtuin-7 n=1 Tax=Dermacentor albipictus TaxID=60249 RepID=UPI0031FDBF80
MADLESSRRELRKSADLRRILFKEEEQAKTRHIRKLMNKPAWERSADEECILEKSRDLVQILQERSRKRQCNEQRLQEVQDPPAVLAEKCQALATAIAEARHLVVYTGAGISTAARIPDYRGPAGVWTLLNKGLRLPEVQDLSQACPTFTHMALAQLQHMRHVKHVVSQNCDGLHVRSGLSRKCLSEVHGNMFLEVCPRCKPLRQYFRLFDVTERTALRRHRTGRQCHVCSADLVDTIVHFGEKGRLRWPLNWQGAGRAADKCDAILCLGTSLKVLRRYRCLWGLDRPVRERPKLYIVNLQWTPKDDSAALKINGRCDDVMRAVMEHLKICVPEYERHNDPLWKLHTPVRPKELRTFTRLPLVVVGEPPHQDHCYAMTIKKEAEDGDEEEDDDKQGIVEQEREVDTVQEREEEEEEVENPKKQPRLVGWYGKGCAKWRRKR